MWYQGGLKPNAPKGYMDVSQDRERRDLRGHEGVIVADFTSRIIIPE